MKLQQITEKKMYASPEKQNIGLVLEQKRSTDRQLSIDTTMNLFDNL